MDRIVSVFSVFGRNRQFCPNIEKYGYDFVFVRETTEKTLRLLDGFRGNRSRLIRLNSPNIIRKEIWKQSLIKFYR